MRSDASTDPVGDFFALDLPLRQWSQFSSVGGLNGPESSKQLSNIILGTFPYMRYAHGAAMLNGTVWIFGGWGLQPGLAAGWLILFAALLLASESTIRPGRSEN